MDIGSVEKRDIRQEMEESYLDYAMSVIVARALPDARDGLKPVHRRILYAMREMGLTAGAKSRKSAAIVGDVLGKYHPHGDLSVYDALVRMAQSFSLRYPLVEGQGNFGCFTKETKVRLADGRNISFGDLVREHHEGKKNFTYTIDRDGKIHIGEIYNPRPTRRQVRLVEIELDNGEKIRCTPDHRFLLRDGTYREAQMLSFRDSLMPLYTRLYEGGDKNLLGYEQVYQPRMNGWVFAHHLADAWNLAAGAYQKSRGRIRHHVDFNKYNNTPMNIQRMHWQEHWKTHYTLTSQKHRNDANYREKLRLGRKEFWSKQENRRQYAERLSLRNRRNWKDPAYRERMRVFLSEVNKNFIQTHPEKRKELGQRMTKTLIRLWQDPEYRERMRENIIKGNKNHSTNKTGKVKFVRICSEVLAQGFPLNEQRYEAMRKKVYPYGSAAKWENGVRNYFQNDPDSVMQEVRKNHRVRSVRHLHARADVYDLTVMGTHNFALAAGVFVHNSIDGDGAAAMRYTEVKLTPIAEVLLADIEKDTVAFSPNYDATRKEPQVLPAALPNLLLNGSVGIAVGMATAIPPHNLGELIDALVLLAQKSNVTHDDIFALVKGPDFPTGGILYGKKDIAQAYTQGAGPMVLRGRAEIIEQKRNRAIIITEIPYEIKKAALIEQIAEMVREKRLEGIRDVRDESDKDGLRVAIELRGDAAPQRVLNALFKMTDLQRTYHLNLLGLVDGIQPRVLSIKAALEEYLKHRREVIRRRSEFEQRRAQERSHILEGLAKALSKIDAVIRVIKLSRSREDAHHNLRRKFALSDAQAAAILSMPLASLARLERERLLAELGEQKVRMKELAEILRSEKKLVSVLVSELRTMRERFADKRRTEIVTQPVGDIADEDLIAEAQTVIVLTSEGYVKRIAPTAFQVQRRGGQGVIGIGVGENERVEHFTVANTHDTVLFFTTRGRVFKTKAYEIPEASRASRGRAVVNFIALTGNEQVAAVVAVPRTLGAAGSIVLVTRQGVVKRMEAAVLANVRRNGLNAMTVRGEDLLSWAVVTDGKTDLLLTTRKGAALRFPETDIRLMGRNAAGVRGVGLRAGDAVAGVGVITKALSDQGFLVVISAGGFGKRVKLSQYRRQRRGGVGVRTLKVTVKTGEVVDAEVVAPETEELIAVSQKGKTLKVRLQEVRLLSRDTQGTRIMKLQPGDRLASFSTL